MAKQNGKTNGSQNGSWQEVEALKQRLESLTEKERERELDKLTPVELHDLFALTASVNLNKKKGWRA